MSDFIQIMRESNSELLKAQTNDISTWSKLKHNKEDLELFLQFNIAYIQFQTNKGETTSTLCTSNTALIKILQLTEKESDQKKKLVKFKGPVIKSKQKNEVLSWDIRQKDFRSINLKSWYILNFISITPKNILILDEIVNAKL